MCFLEFPHFIQECGGIFMTFYDRLDKACKKNNTTVTGLLKTLGLSTNNVTRWKEGKSSSFDVIPLLAEELKVSTDFLLLGKATVDSLSPIEQELINSFRKLSSNEQQRIIGRCEELISSKKETNPEIIEIAARSKKGNVPKISTDEF